MKKDHAEKATIIRRLTDDPFARIPKEMLNDESLSWKAKGILAYLLGKPDDWQPQVGDLENKSSDGDRSIRSGLMELREAGYAQLQKVYGEGSGVQGWQLVVADSPVFPPSTGIFAVRKKKLNGASSIDLRNVDLRNIDLQNSDITKNEGNQEREEPRTKSTPIAKAQGETGRKDRAESIEVVIDYCLTVGLQKSDGDFFWNKWEANGWMNGGKKVKDWRAQIRSWKAAGYCPSQKAKVNGNGYHRNVVGDPLFERALAEVKQLGRL